MRIDGNELIGLRVSKFRKLRGMTQSELAERVELSTTEISNIERGKNSISFNTLINLCRELEVCSCELLSGAIKDKVEENIVDLIRALDTQEKDILFMLLSTYLDNKNIK